MLPALLLPLLAPLIGEVAPALARMATGSETAGRVVGEILPAIGRATGLPVSSAGDVSAALSALRADPAAFERVAAEIRAVEAQELEALLRDRQDARARDVEVRKAAGGGNRRADLLIAAIVALLVAGVAALIFVPDMAQEAKGLLVALGGGLAKSLYDVVAFEFGSSRGSKEKDGQIAALSRPSPDMGIPITPRAGPMAPIFEPEDRPRGLR